MVNEEWLFSVSQPGQHMQLAGDRSNQIWGTSSQHTHEVLQEVPQFTWSQKWLDQFKKESLFRDFKCKSLGQPRRSLDLRLLHRGEE